MHFGSEIGDFQLCLSNNTATAYGTIDKLFLEAMVLNDDDFTSVYMINVRRPTSKTFEQKKMNRSTHGIQGVANEKSRGGGAKI